METVTTAEVMKHYLDEVNSKLNINQTQSSANIPHNYLVRHLNNQDHLSRSHFYIPEERLYYRLQHTADWFAITIK